MKTSYKQAMSVPLPLTEDRRRKYTEVDKQDVLQRHKNGDSIHSIARDTGISKRRIQFWLFPEREALVRQHARERKQWRISYLKEKGARWNARQREYKARKRRLFEEAQRAQD